MKFVVKDKETKEQKSVYGPLVSILKVPCKIFLDNEVVFEGITDELPDNMKNYKYSFAKQDGKITEFYVESKYNELNKK